MRVLDLLERSVILQGFLTTVVVGGTVYLAVTGKPIPDLMIGGFWGVLGFWFGSKSQHVISANRTKRGV